MWSACWLSYPEQQEAKLAELAALRQVMDGVRPVPYEENLRVMELPAVFENFRNRVDQLKKVLESDRAEEARPVGAFLATLDGFFKSLEKEKDRNALGMLREFQGGMFAELPDKLRMLKEQPGGCAGDRKRCAAGAEEALCRCKRQTAAAGGPKGGDLRAGAAGSLRTAGEIGRSQRHRRAGHGLRIIDRTA